MALARLFSRNLQSRIIGSNNLSSYLLRGLSTGGSGKSDGREVAVSDEGKRFKLFPRRRRRGGLWRRNDDRDNFPPAIWDIFPSGLGEALLQATQNMNRLFEQLNINPQSSMMGRYKEDDTCYNIRYDVPGLRKEDVKITVEDGCLIIRGEHKEENKKTEDDEDEFWSSYGYYDASLVLPDDAKVDEIKAEIKNGVLTVTIPRTEPPKKDVKEVQVM